MSKAAPRSRLADLHAMFADYLTQTLKEAMEPPKYDEEGNMIGGGIPLDAATMGVVRTFLKDNEITCEPEDIGTLDELREKYSRQSKARNVAQMLEDAKATSDFIN